MPDSIASTRPKSLTIHGNGRALDVAASLQVERRCRQINTGLDAAGLIDSIKAGDPDGCLLTLGLLGGAQPSVSSDRGWAVGVVRLVVQHQDRGAVVEITQYPTGEGVQDFLHPC